MLRAVEFEKPASERICYDPYARRFLPGWFSHMMRFFIRSGYAEWRGRGVVGFLAAREWSIDDYLFELLVITASPALPKWQTIFVNGGYCAFNA